MLIFNLKIYLFNIIKLKPILNRKSFLFILFGFLALILFILITLLLDYALNMNTDAESLTSCELFSPGGENSQSGPILPKMI